MNAGLFTSNTCEWATPQAFFDALDREFGFDLDVCATAENNKCAEYFSPAADGLSQEWTGVCWMNPPYGRQIGKWIRKAYESSLNGATVVCLIPARTDTAWWHEYVMKGEIRFLRGRIYFEGGNGARSAAPFPSAVVVFRPNNEFGKDAGRGASGLARKRESSPGLREINSVAPPTFCRGSLLSTLSSAAAAFFLN